MAAPLSIQVRRRRFLPTSGLRSLQTSSTARCWKGYIPLHPHARSPLPLRRSYAFRASASGAPLPSAQRCVTSPGSVRGGRSHPGWGSLPSQLSSADCRRMAGISKCGPRLLRMLLMECAWTCARARPTLSKSCPASVDLHIRERARLLLEEAAAGGGRLTLQGECHHSSRERQVHALHRPAGTGAGLNPGCIVPRRHPPTPSIAFCCQSPRKP
jgi:hypothetical protein